MAFNTKWDPEGKTRRIDKRGFYKKAFFMSLLKGEEKCNVESRLELLAAMALELDCAVKQITVQPFTADIANEVILWNAQEYLTYQAAYHREKPVFYTPDFQVLLDDGRTQIIEVKDRDFLNFNADYRQKLLAAKRLFSKKGWGFEFMTNKHNPNSNWVRNLEYLHQFKLTCRDFVLPETLVSDMRTLSLQMHETGEVFTFNELAKSFKATLKSIIFAVINGIFAAPIWTELLTAECRLSGVDQSNSNAFSYRQFNNGFEVML